MPKVSVIVPNYNHAPYLEQRIVSILNQTYQDFELILLDDCSTDNSVDILKHYTSQPKVSHFIVNEYNSGSTFKQWDKGINLAKGEWIWIAESDDWAEKEFLEVMIEQIENEKNVVISYCQSKRVNSESIEIGDWKSWTDDLNKKQFENNFIQNGIDYIIKFLAHKNTIPNASAVIFKKEAYLNVNGVDKDVKYVSDWLLWLKLLLIGDIAFVSQSYNKFRFHDKSVISKALQTDNYPFKYKYDIILRKNFLKKCIKHKSIVNIFKHKLALECKHEARLLMLCNMNNKAFWYWIDVLKYDKNKLRVLYLIIFRFLLKI